MTNIDLRCFLNIDPSVNLVRMSVPAMWLTLAMLAVTACLTWWYAIALCFFFRMLDGNVLLSTTLLLSHKTWLAPSIGTPIIHNLYLNSTMSSIAILSATNSAPYVDVSTVFCLFGYHLIGVSLTKNRIPVTDLLVTCLCAWSAST